MRRPLALFILAFLYCTGKDVIPAKIERKRVGREAYVADVYIGTPLAKYRLEVSFDTPDLIIYTDMKEKSTSYSMDGGGSGVPMKMFLCLLRLMTSSRKNGVHTMKYAWRLDCKANY